MRNQNRVPNNDSKIERQINNIIQSNNWSDVNVCSDDGSVIISVNGGQERVNEVSSIVHSIIGNPEVGDGVQQLSQVQPNPSISDMYFLSTTVYLTFRGKLRCTIAFIACCFCCD